MLRRNFIAALVLLAIVPLARHATAQESGYPAVPLLSTCTDIARGEDDRA